MHISVAQKLLSDTKNLYDAIATDFSQTRKVVWEDFAYFTPFLSESQRVLDVGCGNGRLLEFIKNKKIEYTGIDVSAGLVAEAKKRYAGSTLHPVFKVGSVLDISATNYFDAIFCVAMLHHIPSEELRMKAMEKISSALKPSGMLFMTNWNLYQKKYRGLLFNQTCKKIFAPSRTVHSITAHDLDFGDVFVPWRASGKDQVRYVHALTLHKLKHYVESNGLTVVEAVYARRGKRSSLYKASNSILIAKKNG